ncbi:uncharacterized protein F4817DRAFT_189474 [Daldinia loculata]|uniref:uncharacterized protein n=1 Tax=Daldinia loculata TaxID=103429 RepID=UPI0020C5A25D|nr:uncharacterized protein F4817DRAFT_189474 [Daldinia loculata]KAI1645124.1 hypothetical protein F4817DRAFT_189474 [Daldinia loculata]
MKLRDMHHLRASYMSRRFLLFFFFFTISMTAPVCGEEGRDCPKAVILYRQESYSSRRRRDTNIIKCIITYIWRCYYVFLWRLIAFLDYRRHYHLDELFRSRLLLWGWALVRRLFFVFTSTWVRKPIRDLPPPYPLLFTKFAGFPGNGPRPISIKNTYSVCFTTYSCRTTCAVHNPYI